MDNVEFTDEKHKGGDLFEAPKTPTMVKWVMKTGLVKDERQANIVLVIIAALFFTITFYVFTSSLERGAELTPIEKDSIPTEILSQFPKDVISNLPNKIYIEDLPQSVIDKLTPGEIANIPSRK